MTDSQIPRPTLKLSIKPASLESLTSRITKQTVIIPPKEAIAKVVTPTTSNKQKEKVEKQPKPQKTQKPETEKKIKEKIPPLVLTPYDFFEVYSKLHTKFRAVISIKNPVALAIAINKSIKEVTGLSTRSSKRWTSEYLRRSQYYKKAHIAGANRYNLQGEVVGTVTQEQCDARKEMFKNSKDKMKQKKAVKPATSP